MTITEAAHKLTMADLLEGVWWPGAIVAVLLLLLVWPLLYWTFKSHVIVRWKMHWPIPPGFAHFWWKRVDALPYSGMAQHDNGQTLYFMVSPRRMKRFLQELRGMLTEAETAWTKGALHAEVTTWRWNWTGKKKLEVYPAGIEPGRFL